MTRLIVKRCRLRILRQGGWSWGRDPNQLVPIVISALNEWMEKLLPHGAGEDEDIHIREPLQLRLSMTLSELRGLMGNSNGLDASRQFSSEELEHRFRDAWKETIEPQLASILTSVPCKKEVIRAGQGDPSPIDPMLINAAPDNVCPLIAQVLTKWAAFGWTAFFLSTFSESALEYWCSHCRFYSDGNSHAHELPRSSSRIALLVQRWRQIFDARSSCRREWLMRRLIIAAQVVTETDCSIGSSFLWESIDQAFEWDIEHQPSSPHTSDRGERVIDALKVDRTDQTTKRGSNEKKLGDSHRIPSHEELPHQFRLTSAHHPLPANCRRQVDVDEIWVGDAYVPSALPFLALNPLSHSGYLQSAAASFMAADGWNSLPSLAIQLAQSMWPKSIHQSQFDSSSLIFAGHQKASPVVDWPRLSETLFPPMNSAIALALLKGHASGRPLMLTMAGEKPCSGWLLVECDGLVPIAWVARWEEFAPLVPLIQAETILIPSDCAVVPLLSWIHSQQLNFVCDAPATRGECWSGLSHGNLRGCCNVAVVEQQRAARLLPGIAPLSSSVRRWWDSRSASPLSDEMLVRSCGLASGLALGEIAWRLWHSLGSTEPLLTMERMGNLDARVEFRAHHVRVVLPLGKRSADLSAAGFLDDIVDVPWFAGRVLKFAKG